MKVYGSGSKVKTPGQGDTKKPVSKPTTGNGTGSWKSLNTRKGPKKAE